MNPASPGPGPRTASCLRMQRPRGCPVTHLAGWLRNRHPHSQSGLDTNRSSPASPGPFPRRPGAGKAPLIHGGNHKATTGFGTTLWEPDVRRRPGGQLPRHAPTDRNYQLRDGTGSNLERVYRSRPESCHPQNLRVDFHGQCPHLFRRALIYRAVTPTRRLPAVGAH